MQKNKKSATKNDQNKQQSYKKNKKEGLGDAFYQLLNKAFTYEHKVKN